MHLPSNLIKLLTHPLICKQNYSELRPNCGRTFSKRRGWELGRTVLKLIRKWCLFSKSPFPSWNSLLMYLDSGSEVVAWHPLQMSPDDMLIRMTPRQLSNRASILKNVWVGKRELWRGRGVSVMLSHMFCHLDFCDSGKQHRYCVMLGCNIHESTRWNLGQSVVLRDAVAFLGLVMEEAWETRRQLTPTWEIPWADAMCLGTKWEGSHQG